MTPQEQYKKLLEEKQAAIDARIESEIAAGFLNPFGEGVSYDKFLSVIPEGKTVKQYLTGKLVSPEVTPEKEAELIAWIENDLSHYAPYQDFLNGLEKSKSKTK